MLNAYNLMFPYFTQEEVKRFQNICNSMNLPLNIALCSPKLDALWQPFLNRLNRMDSSISKTIYEGRFKPWRYASFEEGYMTLSEKQSKAIAFIQENHPDLAAKYLNSMDFTGLSLLQQLEKQHTALEDVRIELLQRGIKFDINSIQSAADANLSTPAPAVTFAYQLSKCAYTHDGATVEPQLTANFYFMKHRSY